MAVNVPYYPDWREEKEYQDLFCQKLYHCLRTQYSFHVRANLTIAEMLEYSLINLVMQETLNMVENKMSKRPVIYRGKRII